MWNLIFTPLPFRPWRRWHFRRWRLSGDQSRWSRRSGCGGLRGWETSWNTNVAHPHHVEKSTEFRKVVNVALTIADPMVDLFDDRWVADPVDRGNHVVVSAVGDCLNGIPFQIQVDVIQDMFWPQFTGIVLLSSISGRILMNDLFHLLAAIWPSLSQQLRSVERR